MTRLLTLREIEPYLGRFFSKKWVNKNILQMSDDEIDIMQKEIDKEAKDSPPQDMGAMGGFPPQPSMTPQGSFPATEAEPQDLDLEGMKEELGLDEIPDVEAFDAEENGLTGGETGNSEDKDSDELVSSFEDFFPSKERELILESSKPKSPKFSSKILSIVLDKTSQKQNLHT